MSTTFDIIIVGGGTAGLALAARLTEDPNIQVLVIEAGEDLTTDPRVNMPAMSQSLLNTSSNWDLRTIPQKWLGGRQLNVYGGRLLGGSSAINTFLFVPTSKAHVDAWANLGNPGWEWSSFSESMAKTYTLANSPWGTLGEGPLQISFADEETQWPSVWRETLSNLGFPISMNPFSGQQQGAFMDPESVHPTTKLRSYSGAAYLEPARSRSNLTIWTETLVDKVIFSQSNTDALIAIGVQYTKDGVTDIVKAKKEVILGAGTIHTPKILELSGIGDVEILQPLGIDVAINNPHVGENLQNHVYVTFTSEVVKKEGFETLDKLLQQDPTAIAAAQEAMAHGKGPLLGANTSGSAQMPLPYFESENGKHELNEHLKGFNTKVDQGKATPAFVRAHESFVRSVIASPTEASALYNTFPGFMIFSDSCAPAPHPPGDDRYLTFAVHLTHPLSRGSTHITSPSATSPGLKIDPNYLSHPLDAEMLARHVQHVEKIKKAEPLAKLFVRGGKRAPEVDLSDLEQVKEYARKSCVGTYHFTGTCSQMPREMGGVVDEKLRVYGCKNLRICDLSIVPIVPRCGTQALAYGIAEHAAKIIKSDLKEH
ncbi:GMC oxidoreductase [Annulohypoxylon stygium]|nr:GMC oxidoreductase [Annulohypoxylon stygium]